MGCTSGKTHVIVVEDKYRELGLRIPSAKEYESDFEKQAFMTINVIRREPKLFIPELRRLKSNKLEQLIKKLESIQNDSLCFVDYDQDANQACRTNNKNMLKKDQPAPFIDLVVIKKEDEWQTNKDMKVKQDVRKESKKDQQPSGKGPNTVIYEKLIAQKNNKAVDALEYTYNQWMGRPHELILLNMMNEYEKSGEPAEIDPKTSKVGISFLGQNDIGNIFQIIYVKQNSNQIQ
ncbi:UNKNOWN [Stylonychia lemnae]|uniref:Uncharacterized protein n=1 Tax=Stylonychia lemnae TaxID=5949 RepID=A0A078AIA7_STYLE|nr:UNKNOWN [Stylonychia lemnae]|eukprot:CDW81995.1 UNKNOWN [Stylonychia lemnae]